VRRYGRQGDDRAAGRLPLRAPRLHDRRGGARSLRAAAPRLCSRDAPRLSLLSTPHPPSPCTPHRARLSSRDAHRSAPKARGIYAQPSKDRNVWLDPLDVADTVVWALSQPPHVAVRPREEVVEPRRRDTSHHTSLARPHRSTRSSLSRGTRPREAGRAAAPRRERGAERPAPRGTLAGDGGEGEGAGEGRETGSVAGFRHGGVTWNPMHDAASHNIHDAS